MKKYILSNYLYIIAYVVSFFLYMWFFSWEFINYNSVITHSLAFRFINPDISFGGFHGLISSLIFVLSQIILQYLILMTYFNKVICKKYIWQLAAISTAMDVVSFCVLIIPCLLLKPFFVFPAVFKKLQIDYNYKKIVLITILLSVLTLLIDVILVISFSPLFGQALNIRRYL